jgi:hypothetical protein
MNKKNRGMLMSTSMLVLAVTVTLLCCSRVLGRVDIPFKGNATGGKLVIGYISDPHFVHTSIVSINTSNGESPESVVNRLATAISSSDAIFSSVRKNPKAAEIMEIMRKEMAKGNTLSIRGRLVDYILAGTETGLGIPRPPLCLSCSYNKEARTIDVRWINPSGDCQYDSLIILWRYRSRPEDTLGSGGGKPIWDTPTNFIIKLPEEVNDLDTDIWIRGLRHEMPMEEMRAKSIPLTDNVVPSNVAAIHVTSNGYCQEETYGIPFSAGVAPNWTAWSTAAKVDKATFEQGDKYAGVRLYKPVRALLTKPYYQIIKAQPSGVVHGVYRKFLGLTPGHTYRLTACLTTMEMDSVKGDWSLSLCAIPNRPDGKDLSPQQLAGLAPLPGGRGGPQAGRIAYYGPGKTTKGDFALTFSGDKTADGLQSSHITLPPDANTITVWVRFSCSDPNGKIGFSGVKLEDISAARNVKSPEQIILEENEQEDELLKWQKSALRERSR